MSNINFINKVSNYWHRYPDGGKIDFYDGKVVFRTPTETIFRILGNSGFNYKNKNILDIGFGNGNDLLEFKRRGAKIHGIDIRKKIVKIFIKSNKLNNKNFFACDLNKDFPKVKLMDLINCRDTIYYIDLEKQLEFIRNCAFSLKKNGLLLFQYIQDQFKEEKSTLFNYDLRNGFTKFRKFHKHKNPVLSLKDHHVKNLIKYSNLKFQNSIFDINTHIFGRNKIIYVHRYILLKKIK